MQCEGCPGSLFLTGGANALDSAKVTKKCEILNFFVLKFA